MFATSGVAAARHGEDATVTVTAHDRASNYFESPPTQPTVDMVGLVLGDNFADYLSRLWFADYPEANMGRPEIEAQVMNPSTGAIA